MDFAWVFIIIIGIITDTIPGGVGDRTPAPSGPIFSADNDQIADISGPLC
jgi:hypothetical protein